MSDEALQQRREQQTLDRDQRSADVRAVMDTGAGKRLLWGVIEQDCNGFGGSFVAGHADISAFNEGRRSIGVDLMLEIQTAAPEQYAAMVADRAREAAARARKAASLKPVPNPRESLNT